MHCIKKLYKSGKIHYIILIFFFIGGGWRFEDLKINLVFFINEMAFFVSWINQILNQIWMKMWIFSYFLIVTK